jgi:O-antigen ligase
MNTTLTTARRPRKHCEDGWSKYGLLLLGVSATLYLDLIVVAGFDVRPVQLAPVLIAFIALPFLPSIRADVLGVYFLLPCVWACYMLVRHLAFDDAGQLICARTLVNVIAYFTSLTLLLRTGRINWLLAGLLLGTLISVALALADINLPHMATLSVRMSSGRWQGLMPGANRFGNLCAIASITGIGLLTLKGCLVFRLVLALATAGALLGLAMSGSRGATLTTGLSIIFLLWLTGRVKGRPFFTPRIIVFSGLALMVAVVLFSYKKESIPERLVALIESPDDAMAAIENDVRRDLFEIAFDIFHESPVIGAGASAAIFTIPTRRGRLEISSHSMYLKLLSTSGLVGLIGYLTLPMYILLRLGSSVRRTSKGRMRDSSLTPLALTWLLLTLCHGFVISIAETTHVWLFFAATAYVCIKETERTTAFRFSRTYSRTLVTSIPRA